MRFKNILPPLEFKDDVILDDTRGAAAFEQYLGRRAPRNPSSRDDLGEYALRRYWYFIRSGQNNADCPGHQQVVTKLYFNVLDDARLNACATRSNEYNIVGTNRGAINNIFAFFHLILSHPCMLPDYGFSSQEKAWLVSLGRCNWRGPLSAICDAMVLDESLAGSSRSATDRVRQSIATTLATMALDFVFFHEVAHLRRGHLRFLNTKTGARKIDETRSVYPDEMSQAKQALELDADSGAMETMLTPWLKGNHIKGYQTTEADPDAAIELWTIAVAFLFLMFDPFPRAVSAYRSADHPHPMVRLLHLYVQASHVARTISAHAEKHFQDMWWKALGHVGVVSAHLDLQSSIAYSIQKEAIERVADERQRIVTHLMQLVSENESLQI